MKKLLATALIGVCMVANTYADERWPAEYPPIDFALLTLLGILLQHVLQLGPIGHLAKVGHRGYSEGVIHSPDHQIDHFLATPNHPAARARRHSHLERCMQSARLAQTRSRALQIYSAAAKRVGC